MSLSYTEICNGIHNLQNVKFVFQKWEIPLAVNSLCACEGEGLQWQSQVNTNRMLWEPLL